METLTFKIFTILCSTLQACSAIPLSGVSDTAPSNVGTNYALFLLSGAAIILLIYAAIGCVCCPNKSIKALSYQNGLPVSRLNENSLQFENASEFAIFPPHSTVIDLQPVALPGFEDKVTFEPLPDILPRKLSGPNPASRPAHFRALRKNKVSLHDWFDDPSSNFPRDQLQYIVELGSGWFGRVVEGEASHICNAEEKTKVVVKILREEASPSEHLHFLYEVRPYRDLSHPNVIRLLGRCLESDPFLLIMEHSLSDLKSYLLQQERNEAKNSLLLRMAYNIAAGLKYLHKSGFAHSDLAAHNCFVCPDLSVKVGDYGISFDRHRRDYYCLGDIALPIRWYSPETLLCTETTIETKEVTKQANVWAFGVVLWEMFEFGKLPYEDLTNEEVLQSVLIEKVVQLPPFTLEHPLKEELSLIMRECWKPAAFRPSMNKVENFLTQLYNDRHNLKMLESFEERWNSLRPKSSQSKLSDQTSLQLENDLSVRNDYHNYSSDGETLSSFDTSYDMVNRNSRLSPSLRVLNGSIDELTDACLSSMSCEKNSNDVVSVISDRDISLIDDDAQHCDVLTPEPVPMDLDLVRSGSQSNSNFNLPHIKELQGEIKRENLLTRSVISEAGALSPSSSTVVEMTVDAECTYLDSNSNEMEKLSPSFISVNELQSTVSQCNIKQEHNLSIEENDTSSYALEPGVHIETNCLSIVPDIIVHNAPLVTENEGASCEKEVSVIIKPPKPFRFVFQVDPQSADNPSTSSSANECSPPGSSNLIGREHPLTSTPLKSGLENSSFNCEFVSDAEELESVFYDGSFPGAEPRGDLVQENGHQLKEVVPEEAPYIKGNQTGVSSVETCSPDSVYYETCSTRYPSELLMDTSIKTTNENDYVSAQSTLDLMNCSDISIPYLAAETSPGDGAAVSCTSTSMCALPLFDVSPRDMIHCDTCINNKDSEIVSVIPKFKNSTLEDNSPGISVEDCKEFLVAPNDQEDGREMSSPKLEELSTSEVTSDTSHSVNDYRYSSTESTPFSFNESFSNALGETNITQKDFNHYNGYGTEFLSHQERLDESVDKQETRMLSAGNLRSHKSNSSVLNYSSPTEPDTIQDFLNDNSDCKINDCNGKGQLRFYPYDEVVMEDLETGEQTVISENFSVCDDYENSGESDDILKIDIETDEAIIVDSSEALVGFVPSRSIEMLQECEILPTLDLPFSMDNEKELLEDEREFINDNFSSSLAFKNSPNGSPDSSYALHQPYRNFCLQNEVIEEEITDEIETPSSLHSTASFSSNEIFAGERMSQSSESYHQVQGLCEMSVLPVMDHFYFESDEGSKTDISNSCSDEILNVRQVTDVENNMLPLEEHDVMLSWQPTQSVRWNSDETLDVEDPVIIEGQEILAGSNGITMQDITTALNQMGDRLNCKMLDQLSVSPYSSTESSPCRDGIYTPDFESESDETGSGSASCSSTSGSFECIHNKFKNMLDVTKLADEKEASDSSREQSPVKVFSKTWNCHATPTRGVLVTPEKKFSSLRKSVSFHEEDPQVVFEYPPVIYSSDEEEERKDVKNILSWDIDYKKYADWELQSGENEEIEEVLEIEELDSEPYVRRPISSSHSSLGPLNRPMLYSFTSEFSDEDINDSIAPSNSPEEDKYTPGIQMNELICSQLNNLALEKYPLKWGQEDLSDHESHQLLHSFQESQKQILPQETSLKSLSVQEKVDIEGGHFTGTDMAQTRYSSEVNASEETTSKQSNTAKDCTSVPSYEEDKRLKAMKLDHSSILKENAPPELVATNNKEHNESITKVEPPSEECGINHNSHQQAEQPCESRTLAEIDTSVGTEFDKVDLKQRREEMNETSVDSLNGGMPSTDRSVSLEDSSSCTLKSDNGECATFGEYFEILKNKSCEHLATISEEHLDVAGERVEIVQENPHIEVSLIETLSKDADLEEQEMKSDTCITPGDCESIAESQSDAHTELPDTKSSQCVPQLNEVANCMKLRKESALSHASATARHGFPKHLTAEASNSVPEIVITPASESEVEDELEEYLRQQLEFFHSPEEDFSVTSQYTARPFGDVSGGLCRTAPATDYTEAFNFEFESGDFFEDLLDYPQKEGAADSQVRSEGGMVDRSFDIMQSKIESSPSYYASKDTTHL